MPVLDLHSDSTPKPSTYILDSNIWLPLLGIEEQSSEHYQIFIDKILKKTEARILLCPIQLSELINKLLRYHANKLYFKKYSGKKGIGLPSFPEFYKREYRGTTDFKTKYETIIDDIRSFEDSLVISMVKDVSFDNLTGFNASKLDFNDNYLCLLARESSAILVTDDGDFFEADVQVATFNKKLYKAYKSTIKPNIK